MEVINKIFGSTPSIGELNRLEFTNFENSKNVYILVKLDGENIAKIDANDVIQWSPDAKERIKQVKDENLFLFRCSSAKNLMTNGRGKTNKEKLAEAKTALSSEKEKLQNCSATALKMREKHTAKIEQLKNDIVVLEELAEIVELGETAKKEIQNVWIENKLGRRRSISNKYTEKGITQEDESIKILSEFDGYEYKKNTLRQLDEFYHLVGEFDLKREYEDDTEEIIDVKSRYDTESFYNQNDEEQQKGESDQLDGYLILNPKATRATIANVLTNNSDEAITREIYLSSLKYENGEMPQSEQIKKIKEQVFDFFNFKRLVKLIVGEITEAEAMDEYDSFREIPISMRVIKITRERNEDSINALKQRLIDCYNYAVNKYDLK